MAGELPYSSPKRFKGLAFDIDKCGVKQRLDSGTSNLRHAMSAALPDIKGWASCHGNIAKAAQSAAATRLLRRILRPTVLKLMQHASVKTEGDDFILSRKEWQ